MTRSEYSEEVATQIDRQVREIAVRCHEDARRILRENRPLVDRIVDVLLDQETIEGDQFRKIVEEYQTEESTQSIELAKPAGA